MGRSDFYKALGVSSTAPQEEIQKAYRRLAQAYHPDVNASPEAEERFKEIAAAYETLGDREKRARYDRGGEPRWPGGLWRPRPREAAQYWGDETARAPFADGQLTGRGADREVTLEVTLRDAVRGALRTIELVRVSQGEDGTLQRVREFLEVEVPRGATAGSCIKIRGHGSPGHGGGADGDLYLRVRIVGE